MKKCLQVTIIDYHPRYKSTYKELNIEWLNNYFSIEPFDEQILSDPEQEILANNGHIFFAIVDEQAIGTITLMKLDKGTYELSKMCVTPEYQGQGIGEQLLDKAISFASRRGAQTIMLLTNLNLKAAIQLYEKKGFKKTGKNNISNKKVFMRESIHMSLDLNTQ